MAKRYGEARPSFSLGREGGTFYAELHWDVDLEMGERYAWKVASRPQRFDWEASEWVF